MPKQINRLGAILIRKSLISPKQLDEAVKEQEKTKEFLGAILLRKDFLKSEGFLEALSEQFDLEVVSLKNQYFDWDFVKTFSSELIVNRRCFPLKQSDKQLVMAITNPLDLWTIQKAEEEAMGLKLNLVLVPEVDMQEAISRYREYLRANIDKLFK